MTTTFAESETKVLSFMEAVQEQKLMQEEEDAFKQSTDSKLRTLDKCMNSASVNRNHMLSQHNPAYHIPLNQLCNLTLSYSNSIT